MTHLVEVPKAKIPNPGERRLIAHDGGSLVLFNIDGTLYAINDSCPHNGASLFCGRLQGQLVQCPAHGLRFDLATGCMPNVRDFGVRTYAVERQQGFCVIDLSRPRPQEALACPQQ